MGTREELRKIVRNERKGSGGEMGHVKRVGGSSRVPVPRPGVGMQAYPWQLALGLLG